MINNQPEDKTRSPKNRTIGHCIYCQTKKDLTDEHALPSALDGSNILFDGSCSTCAKITSKFELTILRGLLSEYRRLKGYKSRSNHSKFKDSKIWTVKDSKGRVKDEQIPLKNVGIFLLVPEFSEPWVFTRRKNKNGIEVKGVHFFKALAKKSARAPDISEILVKSDFKLEEFLRFLCKIALCYTNLSYESKEFHSYITRFILGMQSKHKGWWFVGSTTNSGITGNAREVVLYNQNDIITCDIKLFAEIPVIYRVVVGRQIKGLTSHLKAIIDRQLILIWKKFQS